MFSEYKYKSNNYTNIVFNEKNSLNNLYNPWEMFNKASEVTSLLYKSELIDTLMICDEYATNIDFKNIFIIENYHIKESKLRAIIENNDTSMLSKLESLFSLGKIHTLVPNFFYLRLFEIFNFKFKINNIARDYNFRFINDKQFQKLMLDYFENTNWGSEVVIDKTFKIALSRLYKIRNSKIRQTLQKKIMNIFYQSKNRIIEIKKFEDSDERIEIENLLFKNIQPKESPLLYYYNKYYLKFEILFKKQITPIMGVIYRDRSFDIFSKYSLYYDQNHKNYFINLKKLSHSSPIIIDIATNISVITGVVFGIFEGYNRIRKNSIESEKLKLENEKLKLENEEAYLNLQIKKEEFYKQYFSNQIEKFRKHVDIKYKNLSEKYEIRIDPRQPEDL